MLKRKQSKPEKTIEKLETSESLRGGGALQKYTNRQNYIMIYGCEPGVGVRSDTNMVKEIAGIFNTRFEKDTFSL